MKKKNFYINILPTIIWLTLFICSFILKIFNFEEAGSWIGLGYILLLIIVPIFFGIYNFITTELEEMFKLYVISLSSQLIGLALNGFLHYYFISSDSETPLVIQFYLLITLVCTVIIDLIAILIKLLSNKLKK